MNVYDSITKEYSDQEKIAFVDKLTDSIAVDKPFRVRMLPLFVIVVGVIILCQVISAATEFYMLSNWLKSFPFIASIIFAFAALVFIEVLKGLFAKDFFKSLFFNRHFSIFSFILLASLQSTSIFISFQGAKALPKEIIDKPVKKAPVLIDIKNLGTIHDSKISAQQKAIDKYFIDNRKPNGLGGYRLSSRYMAHYNSMIAHKQDLEKNKIEAIKQATTTNKKTENIAANNFTLAIAQYNIKLSQDGTLYGIISLIIEGIFLLAFSVLYYFLKRSHTEKNAINDKQNANATLKNPINSTSNANNVNNNAKPKQVSLVASANRKAATFIDYNDKKVRNCNNCNANYEYKRKTSKYCSTACRLAANSVINKS